MDGFWIWIAPDVPGDAQAWLRPALLCLPQVLPVEVLGRACIRSSLIFRDAMRKLGHRATVEVCDLLVEQDGRFQRVGTPLEGQPVADGFWSGHIVTIVDGILVDTTVWQADAAREGLVPAVAAVRRSPLTPVPEAHFGPGLSLRWFFGVRNETWKSTGDANPASRRPLVEALIDRIRTAEPRRPSPDTGRGPLTRAVRGPLTTIRPTGRE